MSTLLLNLGERLKKLPERLHLKLVSVASILYLFCQFMPNLAHAEASLPSPEGSLIKVSLALLAVLIALVLVARLMKRFSSPKLPSQSVARLVGGVSLGARERVVVLEVGNQWIVVGVAPSGLTALANIAANPEVTPNEVIKVPDFSSIIKQVIK